jgi:hypothetical protein
VPCQAQKQNIKNYYKMENATKFLLAAASIAVGVTLGTWAYNKFLSNQ